MKDQPITLRSALDRLAVAELSLSEATGGRAYALVLLGEACRRERERKGLSLRHVADRMGITAPFLSDCELGRRWFSEENETAYLNLLQCQHAERDMDGCCKDCGMGL